MRFFLFAYALSPTNVQSVNVFFIYETCCTFIHYFPWGLYFQVCCFTKQFFKKENLFWFSVKFVTNLLFTNIRN